MEFIGTALSGIRGLVGALIPFIRKKYFDQPKIYLIFSSTETLKSSRGPSGKNDRKQPPERGEIIQLTDLSWEYDLTLRNNSEHAAHNLKLIKPEIDSTFYLNPPIDSLEPILPYSKITFIASFLQFYEGKDRFAIEIMNNPPTQLQTGTFIFEYTNVKGTKFYTKFNFSEADDIKNKFVRKV